MRKVIHTVKKGDFHAIAVSDLAEGKGSGCKRVQLPCDGLIVLLIDQPHIDPIFLTDSTLAKVGYVPGPVGSAGAPGPIGPPGSTEDDPIARAVSKFLRKNPTAGAPGKKQTKIGRKPTKKETQKRKVKK